MMLEPPFLGVRHPMEVVRLDEVLGVLLEQYQGRLYPCLVKVAYLKFRKEVCVRKTRLKNLISDVENFVKSS